MLISTTLSVYAVVSDKMFQSLDWVDVDFDTAAPHPLAPTRPSFNPSTGLMLISTWSGPSPPRIGGCFNPSTGLMLISTTATVETYIRLWLFQSLDWVDVDFDIAAWLQTAVEHVSIPRLG